MISPDLCKTCLHAKVVQTARGSVFWLCQAHKFNPKMPKYPRLPVLACAEYRQVGNQT